MTDCKVRLALHAWTLGVGRVRETAEIAAAAGYDAVELSWQDLGPNTEAAVLEDIAGLLEEKDLVVSAIGVEPGWIFASGDARETLFARFDSMCRIAALLRCPLLIGAVGHFDGADVQAAENIRIALDSAGESGLSLALEPNFGHQRLNDPLALLELIDRAGGVCGLVLDSYHLNRAAVPFDRLAQIEATNIYLVHVSDVPFETSIPGPPLDRLMPGEGRVDWERFSRLLDEKRYTGFVSLEAPNPRHWAGDHLAIASAARSTLHDLLAADGSP